MIPIGVYPDAELVICAWIMSIPDIQIGYADWRLPWDLNVPSYDGYAQVTVIGGVPDQNVPLFHTTVQVDTWAEAPSEDRVFRLRASHITKQIQYACWDRQNVGRGVTPVETLDNGNVIQYPGARVYSAYTLTEPHQIQSKDNPLYEGYSMDMAFTWNFGMTTN